MIKLEVEAKLAFHGGEVMLCHIHSTYIGATSPAGLCQVEGEGPPSGAAPARLHQHQQMQSQQSYWYHQHQDGSSLPPSSSWLVLCLHLAAAEAEEPGGGLHRQAPAGHCVF